MSRIVLVSNRVMDQAQAAQAGGVAVALADILRERGGLWFGWNGQVTDDETARDTLDFVENGYVSLATVPLGKDEYDQYYLGYANSVLWPVFHNRLDLAKFKAGHFEAYARVNRRLARLLEARLRPDDIVWVHDYHFIPFALELRRLGVANPIGFFLHIPFPPAQTFLALPEHQELAEALAAFDLVGLQTKGDVANMIDYLEKGVAGRILQDGRIRVFDRLLSIASYPVGIDPREFAEAKPFPTAVQARPTARRIIGIDRLDYTKGLPQKFQAYGRFLEKYPEYCGEVMLTQIAPPTRESVEAYTDIRLELERMAGSINGRFGELDWVPIHYIHRTVARKTLADIYRSARIGLVTPLRDGMNLVAKEYVAAQDPSDPGVLVLSQFAGAAEEMTAALLVNPYNIDETADILRAALEMSLAERLLRHGELMAGITRADTFAWRNAFLSALAGARSDDGSSPGWRSVDKMRALVQKLQRVMMPSPGEPETAPFFVPPRGLGRLS